MTEGVFRAIKNRRDLCQVQGLRERDVFKSALPGHAVTCGSRVISIKDSSPVLSTFGTSRLW
ncbi:hypothetical protein J6590_071860 [Homalodisca vitripennis]|nr:hypothetical protein J6590_071860 [Homalodisca vitripennis]